MGLQRGMLLHEGLHLALQRLDTVKGVISFHVGLWGREAFEHLFSDLRLDLLQAL